MTYTIIGRCSRTGRLGIGITTFSLAVGGYCPSMRSDVSAVSSHAYANPQLGGLAVQLLHSGLSPTEVLQRGWRDRTRTSATGQVGIVGVDGAGAAWTGSETRPWTGHVTGEDFVAMGLAFLHPTTRNDVGALQVAHDQHIGLFEEDRPHRGHQLSTRSFRAEVAGDLQFDAVLPLRSAL